MTPLTYADSMRQLVNKLGWLERTLQTQSKAQALQALRECDQELAQTSNLTERVARYLNQMQVQSSEHLQQVENQLNASYEEQQQLKAQINELDAHLAGVKENLRLSLEHRHTLEDQLNQLHEQIEKEQRRRKTQSILGWIIPLYGIIAGTVDLLESLSGRFKTRYEEWERMVAALKADETYAHGLQATLDDLTQQQVALTRGIAKGTSLQAHLQQERVEDKGKLVLCSTNGLNALLLRNYLQTLQHALTDEADVMELLSQDEHGRLFALQRLNLEIATNLLSFGAYVDTLPASFETGHAIGIISAAVAQYISNMQEAPRPRTQYAETPVRLGVPALAATRAMPRILDGAGNWMQQVSDEVLLTRFGGTTRSLWSALRKHKVEVAVNIQASGAGYSFVARRLDIAKDWLDVLKSYVERGEKAASLGRAAAALTHELSHAHDHIELRQSPANVAQNTDAFAAAVLKTEVKAWMKEARAARENSSAYAIAMGADDMKLLTGWLGVYFSLLDKRSKTNILQISKSDNLVIGRLHLYFNNNKSTQTPTTLEGLLHANSLWDDIGEHAQKIREQFKSTDAELRQIVVKANAM